jgi:hypothetical protein
MSMEAEEIFFADQNLATEQQDQFNQNEVLKKFKHFLRVNFSSKIPPQNPANFTLKIRNGQLKMNSSTVNS